MYWLFKNILHQSLKLKKSPIISYKNKHIPITLKFSIVILNANYLTTKSIFKKRFVFYNFLQVFN